MNTKTIEHYFAKAFSELRIQISKDVSETLNVKITNSLISSTKEERLLKDNEVCKYLGISISKFYQFKRKYKNFPTYEIDGSKRYKISEIEEFLKNLN